MINIVYGTMKNVWMLRIHLYFLIFYHFQLMSPWIRIYVSHKLVNKIIIKLKQEHVKLMVLICIQNASYLMIQILIQIIFSVIMG
jgi:hypothetical protein